LNFRHENEICPIDGGSGGCSCDIFIYIYIERERWHHTYICVIGIRVCVWIISILLCTGTRAVEKLNDFTGFFYDRKGVNEYGVCVCVSKEGISSKRCRSRRHTISRRFRLTRLLLLLLLSSHARRRLLLCIRLLLLWLSAGHVFPTTVNYQTLLRARYIASLRKLKKKTWYIYCISGKLLFFQIIY